MNTTGRQQSALDWMLGALAESAATAWQEIRTGWQPAELLAGRSWEELSRVTAPVEPFNRPELLAPVIGLAGVVFGLVLAGVALGALGTLLLAILGMGILLSRLYGISLEVVALGA